MQPDATLQELENDLAYFQAKKERVGVFVTERTDRMICFLKEAIEARKRFLATGEQPEEIDAK